ncbi:MAG: response regulator RpfG family c-di-GMP phosphodiesterase [Crocinitomicaceae bacterium]|jgi:response regulator RpfG family c-di-GMP phosphodiesterase
MSEEKLQVLYVDDERHNLTSFKATYRKDFSVHTAESAEEGLKILKENEINVVLSDQRMPKMTGVEFFKIIKKEYPEPIRILITGYSDIEAVIDSINQGQVYRYISKPWEPNDLRLVIEQANEVFSLRKENARLMEALKDSNQKLEFIARQNLLS